MQSVMDVSKLNLRDKLTGEEWVNAGYTNILNFEKGIKRSHYAKNTMF